MKITVSRSCIWAYLVVAFLGAAPIFAIEKRLLPYTTLVDGILNTNQRRVNTALHGMNVDVSNVTIGNYGDTPLMLAVRVYCQLLHARSKRGIDQSTMWRLMMTPLAPLMAGGIAYTATDSKWIAALAGFTLLPFSYRFFFTDRHHIVAARIVESLVEATPNISARNKEGLTAVDILRAYYEIAYQLQEESWFTLLHLLTQKEETAA